MNLARSTASTRLRRTAREEHAVKIGLTLQSQLAPAGDIHCRQRTCPDDAEEEFDSPETIEALTAAFEDFGHEVELARRWHADAAAPGRRLSARSGVQFRRGNRHGPIARSPRSRGARNARHSLHRLRSVDAGRHARQAVRKATGARAPAWPRPIGCVVDGDIAEFRNRLAGRCRCR